MTPIRRTSAVLALAAILVAGCTVGATPVPATAGPSTSAASVPPSASAASVPPSAGGSCPTAQPAALAAGETRVVTIATDKGEMGLTIEADLSPIAAGNFVALAECGYYDGVVFHRVIPGFVIQGGDGEFGRTDAYNATNVGTGGPGYTIKDEPVTAIYSRGTIAMARSALPDSVGSQFFIVLDDEARSALADPMYNNYQIIGTVTAGLEAADAIAAAADQENPTTPVVMTDVRVSTP
jgi:cyclophilin family peptidyl-prolyl cis-trans isomerase